jgi:hypothetical protein
MKWDEMRWVGVKGEEMRGDEMKRNALCASALQYVIHTSEHVLQINIIITETDQLLNSAYSKYSAQGYRIRYS